jgi:hypothetical protein
VYASPPVRGNAINQRGSFKQLDVRGLDLSTDFNITDAWNIATGLDYATIAANGTPNINIFIYAIDSTSFVSGVAQSTTGRITPTPLGIGSMIIGSSFIVS